MASVYELVTSVHNGAGNFFQNVFHYELSEAGSGVSPWEYAQALNNAWIALMETDYLDLFGVDIVLDFISAKKINNGGGPSNARQRGTFGGALLASSTSGASADIQWQSNSPTNRPGHTYIAAFAYNFLQADVFQSGFTTKAATFITDMLTPLVLGGALGTATFCIYTRKTDTQHTVLHGSVRPKATMMNRRLVPQI